MAVPIPAIFLLETTDDQGTTENEVIDGVQRLSTLASFVDNELRLSKGLKLSGLEGRKFESLDDTIKEIFLNRDISIITIEKNTDSTIQFEIFERLNRGSVSLTHQELRNCMYHGYFNGFLNRISSENKDYRDLLSEFPNFKPIEKGKPDKSRMQDVEMVLRFFYLFESNSEFLLGDSKSRFGYPTKEQLNSYMKTKKEQEKNNEDFSGVYIKSNEELEAIFNKVCQMVKLTFKNKQFKKFSLSNNKKKFNNAFNKAFFDIQMLGFVDYEVNDISEFTDIIYNEFIELCYFNTVMADNTNEKIAERVNTWKDSLSDILTDDTNNYRNKLNRKIEHFNFDPTCLSCSEKVEELYEGYFDSKNNAFYHAACYIKENQIYPPESIDDPLPKMKIGVIARTVFRNVLESGKVSENEIERMQDKDYSKKTFGIQYPVLQESNNSNSKKPENYYKKPVNIFNKYYFICSEWYEIPANNDRPYLIKWLEPYLFSAIE
jgi:hypothetical protein